MSRQCCRMCRHYRSAVVGFDFEPLDDDAVCNVHRKAVDADDWCNSFALSLWGAAKLNGKVVFGEAVTKAERKGGAE